MNGYTGKVLFIDLSCSSTETQPLQEKIMREDLGQRGLAAAYYAQFCSKEAGRDALVFMTGPLSGLFGPGTGHFQVVGSSCFDDSVLSVNCGGHFGPELKMAGFDGLVITGKAATPQYLYISDAGAELRDASALWGKDAGEVLGLLDEACGPACQALCIGTAAEQFSPFAGLADQDLVLPDSAGLGAVFASRNLKAVVAKGSFPLTVADPDRYLQLAMTARQKLENHPIAGTLSGAGPTGFDALIKAVDRETLWAYNEGIDRLHQRQLRIPIPKLAHPYRRLACYSCPVGCRHFSNIGEEWGPGSEGDAMAAFGSLASANKEDALRCYWLCVESGLDGAAFGRAAARAGLRDLQSLLSAIKSCSFHRELLWPFHTPAPVESGVFAAHVSGKEEQEKLFAFWEDTGVCPYFSQAFPVELLIQLVNAATGLELALSDALRIGQSTCDLEARL